MSHHKYIHFLRYFVIIIGIIAFFYFAENNPWVKEYLSQPESIKTLVLSWGIAAPVVIILLQFLQSTVSIIPGQVTTIAAGFLFGPIWGGIYSLIGVTLGSETIYSISKKYGKKLALKIFNPIEMAHFQHFFKQKGNWSIFLARIMPFFPNDLVSFTAGLIGIKRKNFHLYSTLGFIPQIILFSLIGWGLSPDTAQITLAVLVAVVILLFLAVIFKNKIKYWVIKDLRKAEKVMLHQKSHQQKP
ncbi:TVP38/TMEM64 family protein [Candidatus Woesearchaeota archaeon]|nr:TVP38/TMEM64 family protein [Candidatus Woesearchaeota archaeon]